MRKRMAYPMAPAAPVTVTVLGMARNLSAEGGQRLAEGGAGAHRRGGALGVGPVVAADVHGRALDAVELGDDRRLVVGQLLRQRRESRRQVGVLALAGELPGPVQRQVEVAAAVVE